jgi:hypothetical protein
MVEGGSSGELALRLGGPRLGHCLRPREEEEEEEEELDVEVTEEEEGDGKTRPGQL